MELTIESLTKTYTNKVKALDNLSLELGKGMFGLLGPNGAGKSSLMRTIATLQLPDDGNLHFDGIDILKNPMHLRRVLGYLPQNFGVYPGVSGEKLLDYMAVLKGIHSKKDRKAIVQHVLELTNLYDSKKKNVSGYSGGMKQRFGIAQLLLNNPKLLIVDEPTAGLDPAERNRFLNVLRLVGADNVVIFSTHIVEDVKDLCSDMAIINKGKVLKHQTPKDAVDSLKGKIWAKQILPMELSIHEDTYRVISSGYKDNNSVEIRVFAETETLKDFDPAAPTLEDVYFLTINH
ncbi:MAG: ABC transporter ATP-binding protein [Ekhidna sp.]